MRCVFVNYIVSYDYIKTSTVCYFIISKFIYRLATEPNQNQRKLFINGLVVGSSSLLCTGS